MLRGKQPRKLRVQDINFILDYSRRSRLIISVKQAGREPMGGFVRARLVA